VLDDLLSAIAYRNWLFDSQEEKTAAIRWRNVTDFCDWLKKRAEEEGATLVQLAQSVAILSQLDRRDSDLDAVRLSTIHAAKGLEFAHVFVVGCEEGVLPHQGSVDPENDEEAVPGTPAAGQSPPGSSSERIEEERRLMYVAITRAQRSLTLSWSRERRRARQSVAQQPSRFIAEMALSDGSSPRQTVSNDTAKARLGALKDLLAAKRSASER
jgi:ATP-dependent DNA helicase Rep